MDLERRGVPPERPSGSLLKPVAVVVVGGLAILGVLSIVGWIAGLLWGLVRLAVVVAIGYVVLRLVLASRRA